MSVKSLKKQLMAAIAMVIVSAVALSSSTYAWFATNNKVTATGMQVQAQAEGGIEIAYAKSTDSTGTWGTSATAGMTAATKLMPTSTENTQTGHWYHASAEKGSASSAKVDTYATLVLSAGDANKKTAADTSVAQDTTQYYDATGNQFYLVKNFVVRSTSSSQLAKGLTIEKVSVSGHSSTNTMSNALRVAVVLGDKAVFYAPVSGATTSYDVYSGYSTVENVDTATKAGTVELKNINEAQLLADTATTEIPVKTSSTNGGVDVQIYVYFEGEDAALYSENFSTEGLIVTVDFSATV